VVCLARKYDRFRKVSQTAHRELFLTAPRILPEFVENKLDEGYWSGGYWCVKKPGSVSVLLTGRCVVCCAQSVVCVVTGEGRYVHRKKSLSVTRLGDVRCTVQINVIRSGVLPVHVPADEAKAGRQIAQHPRTGSALEDQHR